MPALSYGAPNTEIEENPQEGRLAVLQCSHGWHAGRCCLSVANLPFPLPRFSVSMAGHLRTVYWWMVCITPCRTGHLYL